MNVLLSIKPAYSKKIFSGEKRYEFRKQKPQFEIDTVFVYESSPTRQIVGGFSVKQVHSDLPERIWKKCSESSGIERKCFLDYCAGAKVIHVFEIDEVFKFDIPLDPFGLISDFKPPQSFSYLKLSAITEILERSRSGVTDTFALSGIE